MKRCAIDISSSGTVKFKVQEGEEDHAESILDMLEAGDPPTWLQNLLIEELMRNLVVEGWEIISLEPEPDEDLNFEE